MLTPALSNGYLPTKIETLKDDRKFFKYDEPKIKLCNLPNEVIVYRVMMYANSLLIVQAMYACTSLPKINLYITVIGGDFSKY